MRIFPGFLPVKLNIILSSPTIPAVKVEYTRHFGIKLIFKFQSCISLFGMTDQFKDQNHLPQMIGIVLNNAINQVRIG